MPFGAGGAGRAWSVILVVTALARATSYCFRPPTPTATTEVLTGQIPYSAWVWILFAGCALVVAGIAHSDETHGSRWLAFIGHFVLCLAYVIYALSVVWASVFLGDPWAGIMLLVVVAYLHARRIITIGAHLGRQ